MQKRKPTTQYLTIGGIRYHLLTWHPASGPGDPVLLLHGSKDRGTSFDELAPILADAGYSVFAPDMRGHGATDSGLPAGGYQIEYFVADVADLVETLSPNAPIFLAGHSIGGMIATLYAGSYPTRIRSLILMDGLGFCYPDANSPDRLRIWIEGNRIDRRRPARRVTQAHAAKSLAAWNPEAGEAIIQRRITELTQELDGGLAWWFDPIQWRPIWEVSFERWQAHARRITAPTLVVSGGKSAHHPEDEQLRIQSFKKCVEITIEGAGHMIHWTAPEQLGKAFIDFIEIASIDTVHPPSAHVTS